MAEERLIRLRIITPEGTIFEGEVLSVSLPGSVCPFVVLYDHAPIISTLTEGEICWLPSQKVAHLPAQSESEQVSSSGKVQIKGGVCRVRANQVDVCAEV